MKLCLACQYQFASIDWCCTQCGFQPVFSDKHYFFAPELAIENNFFPAEGFTYLAEAENKNFWFRARNNLITWALKKYFPEMKNFLEIGCGTGFVLSGIAEHFPNIQLFGSEIYKDGLLYSAKRLPHSQFFQMDARYIPFKDEFDVIGAFDMLEHVQEDEQVLGQMFQAIRPGGGLILSVPQHPFLWSQVDEYSHHFRRYTVQELTGKIKRAGFNIVRTTSFVSLLFPLLVLSRLRNKKNDGSYNPKKELNMQEPLNTILYKLLAFERRLIENGFNFPFGGSVLAIAIKK